MHAPALQCYPISKTIARLDLDPQIEWHRLIMDVFSATERRIRQMRPAGLVACLLLLEFLRAGVWTIPSISSLNTLALDPFANPYTGSAQILFTNWLGPFIAYSVGISGQWPFTLLHVGFSCLFLLTVGLSLYRTLPLEEWRKAICIFAILPVSWTHLYWIGYDSLTLALMALIMASLHRPWLAFIFGLGLGLQHFEQGLLGFAALAVALGLSYWRCPGEKTRLRGAAWAIVGLLTGRAILAMIVRHNHITFDHDRSVSFLSELGQAFATSALGLPFVLASLLGLGWIIVMRDVKTAPHRWPLYAALAGALVVSIGVFDNTRVFACITFPVIACYWLYDRAWLEAVPTSLIAGLVLAWTVTPWMFCWGGKPYASVLPYDITVIVHNVAHWPQIPDRQHRSLWPFLH
ncbi:hypothetical protein P7D22_16775 [Lichenihabitans sp. Uapishka_5]|uniref:hypothetical protein n=1 Tax=Lichenihabitans sp. Uapishka_5 TaxID=3037302 RepID=UPI0029E7F87F|nr:hypothetical protein [Lichenihabitans sp. Uapishka_5]MDX7952824.1 hypothetical protein [Lichenihabitans sp. Uapishka_5]